MRYYNSETQAFPYTLNQLRQLPGVSFPPTITDELAASYGVYPVTSLPQPEVTAAQVAERAAQPEEQGGAWVWGWAIRDLSPPEIAAKLQAQKAEMQQRVKEAYSIAMQPISEAYPLEEREGWPEQIEAAKEVIANGQSDLIDVLAAARGLSAADMAQTILRKQAEYRVVYGAMTANLHRLDDLITTAASLEDLAEVDVAEGWVLLAQE